MSETVTLTLPKRYAHDWWQRCGMDYDMPEPTMASYKSRVCTMTFNDEQLADLISDVKHYTGSMRDEYAAEGSRGIVLSADATRKRIVEAGLM